MGRRVLHPRAVVRPDRPTCGRHRAARCHAARARAAAAHQGSRAAGQQPVQVPGRYGRTITISQDRETMYYLETSAPQAVEDMPGVDAFPLRVIAIES